MFTPRDTNTSYTGESYTGRRRARSLIGAVAAGGLLAGLVGVTPTNAQGFVPGDVGVGFFYGTFDDGPNPVLLAGGTVEDFCDAGPDGDPSTTPGRIFLRAGGEVDIKTNAKDQPIYLYEGTEGRAPDWIDSVCEAKFDDDPSTVVPRPDATGTANLKVRITDFSDGNLEIFNSVNGTLVANDGREYHVLAAADVSVVGGELVGDPADFVSFDLNEIRR